ncbi:inorganic diphosphatase [Thomasclavelia sp.]
MQKVEALDYLDKEIHIIIDRPLGSKHPKHNFIYLLNYGYVPETISGDGEELDAYLLGIFEPVENYTGKVLAVIKRIDDNDDKLIVVPKGINYNDEQIRALTEFQERFFESEIIRGIDHG